MDNPDDGKNLIQMLRDVRKYFGEVAKLLGVAESSLEEHGLELAEKSAYKYGSALLSYPGDWLPYVVIRMFKVSQPGVRVFVSAILDLYPEYDAVLTQPIVCSGWIDFGDQNPEDVTTYWVPSSHVRIGHHPADGKWYTTRNTESKHPIELRAFGVPLTSILGEPQLQSLVLQPLLKEVESRWPRLQG
ncbi:MAG: hypothetical protein IT464_01080 [Planctomycetes bacterium]|nr:hypothetical protein [Planctomycetota bacterium]